MHLFHFKRKCTLAIKKNKFNFFSVIFREIFIRDSNILCNFLAIIQYILSTTFFIYIQFQIKYPFYILNEIVPRDVYLGTLLTSSER